MTDTIGQALHDVQARVAAACRLAGRPDGSVQLVAVSKTYGAEAITAAIRAGQLVFGENRVQEAQAKFPALREAHPALRLHLIGGLQTNKALDAVRVADVVESLDRPRLADAIEVAVQKAGRSPDLLVQVNVGEEDQKAGVPPSEADAFIENCMRRFGPALSGLMCIPPATAEPDRHFASLVAQARRHGLPVISMGMSGDFEAAVRLGATQVRVGSAIFGARPAMAGA